MEIGSNFYNYNIDYTARANGQQQATSKQQGVEQDARGLEKMNLTMKLKTNKNKKIAPQKTLPNYQTKKKHNFQNLKQQIQESKPMKLLIKVDQQLRVELHLRIKKVLMV